MYAVIVTGGKQYRVEVGTELEVELLDVEPGQAITLDRVLLVADGDESAIGRPLVADAAVSAEVVRQTRGEKLIAFKYRPKARSRVKKGHRQELTVLRITDVRLGSKSAAESVRKAEADAKTERQRLEEAAAKQAAADAALAAKLAKSAPAESKAAKASTAKSKATATKAEPKASSAKTAPKKPAAKASAADDKTTKKAAPKAAPKTTRAPKDK
jgi:large subunit ribosomal protein L21